MIRLGLLNHLKGFLASSHPSAVIHINLYLFFSKYQIPLDSSLHICFPDSFWSQVFSPPAQLRFSMKLKAQSDVRFSPSPAVLNKLRPFVWLFMFTENRNYVLLVEFKKIENVKYICIDMCEFFYPNSVTVAIFTINQNQTLLLQPFLQLECQRAHAYSVQQGEPTAWFQLFIPFGCFYKL